ncbi:GFA family protein [Ponticaulis koreensis]|uniref:GFA family protein n=1 Tax=Ponticaulis koreensis TaxID=1123045 RepID=UPI0003B4E440|nr:GFA family protein [Ponticaulis koreensis]
MSEPIHGQCLCGDVSFRVESAIDHVDACHCKMCQRWNGAAAVTAILSEGGLVFEKDQTLSWYNSSEWAQRGFCSKCGSSLFYRLKDNPDFWSISSGSLDLPDGIAMKHEIFIDEKPAYYAFTGDHPRLTGEETMAMFNTTTDGGD